MRRTSLFPDRDASGTDHQLGALSKLVVAERLWRLVAALTVVLLCGFTCVSATPQSNKNIVPPSPSTSPTPPKSDTSLDTRIHYRHPDARGRSWHRLRIDPRREWRGIAVHVVPGQRSVAGRSHARL